MKVGFSGHQDLPPEARQKLLQAIEQLVSRNEPLTVCCSLAAGADQLVAGAVLNAGGQLDVVLPCRDYANTFDDDMDGESFQALLARSGAFTELPFPGPSEEAFMAAGVVVVERCDVLVAAWDSEPASGLGGTADVVAYAQSRGVPVKVVWPKGISR